MCRIYLDFILFFWAKELDDIVAYYVIHFS